MGMFDYITVEAPLPDNHPTGGEYQTKSFECFMECYRITSDGRLLHTVRHSESVPEEERPNWGTPEWDTDLGKLYGCIKMVEDGIEEVNYHGDVYFYRMGPHDIWEEYCARFTNGRLQEITLDRRE